MASEIIVSINVQSGKAEVNLGKAKKGVDKLAAAKKRLAEANADVAVEIAKVNLQTKQQIETNNQNAAQILKNVNKTSGTFRTQVGLNNAILTEAGRAASDMRFGFNGVANNVGQIASLFGSLITTSDNVGKSLMQLVKSLVGVGGFLIAVQLLIAYGDQIYNFFFNASAAAAELQKKMESLLKPIKQNRLELLGYMEVLKDTTSSEQARIEALDELGKALPDAVDDNGELKISYTQLGLAVEDYVEQLTIRAEIEATIELNSEKFSKRRKVRALEEIKDEAEKNKAIKKYLDEELSFADTSFALGETLEEQTNFRRLSQTEKNKLRFAKLKQETEAEAQQIIDSLKKLQQKLKGFKEDPSGGGGGDARIRVFKEKTLELEKLEQRYRENSIDKDLQTNQERIAQFQQNEFAKLDILEENFITRESLRLKNYIESIENQKISDDKKLELIADAEAKFTNEIKIAGEDRLKVGEQIFLNSQLMRNKQIRESAEIARTEQENSFELDRQSKLNRGETQIKDLALLEEAKSQTILEQLLGTNRTEIRVTRDTLELKKSYAEDEIKRINDLLSNSEISQERRSQLENDLTVQQGIQTDTRIQILGLEEKAKDELVDSVALGLGAVSSLLKKGTDAQKAVSIASTLISTYTSAQKAYESQLTATPDSPIRAVIAATSAVVQGLARVQAIRKVNPAGKNGSASSAPSVSAPSFNVVGASPTNQLAQTVAGQVNAPLRAYVVGSDISDQQELDRSIISTAGIG
jgi:hypothetical protein